MELEAVMLWVKPEYIIPVTNVHGAFVEKLSELKGNYSGAYLLGISRRPWDKVRFIIGDEEYCSRITLDSDESDIVIVEAVR